MELPPLASHYEQKLRFGAYVEGMTRLYKQAEIADQVAKAGQRLRKANHALDDITGDVQKAMAQRDFWMESYESKARDFYTMIKHSKDLHTITQSIFQDKHSYYIEPPLDEIEKRGQALIERIERFVPRRFEDLKKKTVKILRRRIDGVLKAHQAVAEARQALKEARTKRSKASKYWQRILTESYANLTEALSAETADKIYPDLHRVQDDEDDRVGSLGEAAGGMNLQMLALKQR